MRGRGRIFMTVCVCVMAIGVALCAVGVIMGGTFGVAGSYLGEKRFFNNNPVSQTHAGSTDPATKDLKEAERISGIRELNVDVDFLKIIIHETEGTEITVDTSQLSEELKHALSIKQSGQRLDIITNGKEIWKNIFMPDIDYQLNLRIGIPKDWRFQEVNLNIGAGDLEADYLNADYLNVEVGAGQALINDFEAVSANVKVGAGKLGLSGNAEREITLDCGVGEIDFQAFGLQEHYNYDVNCNIGSVVVGSEEYSGFDSTYKQYNNGRKKIFAECGIGSINISFNNDL